MKDSNTVTKVRHKLYFVWDDRKPADPFKDGYIGVTCQDVEQRVEGHKRLQFSGLGKSSTSGNGNERKMYKILKEIPDEHIKFRTMMWHEDPEVIAKVEEFFRPEAYIGVTCQDVEQRVEEHKRLQYSGLGKSSTSGNGNERKMYKILKEIPDEHIKFRTMMWHEDPEVIAKVCLLYTSPSPRDS